MCELTVIARPMLLAMSVAASSLMIPNGKTAAAEPEIGFCRAGPVAGQCTCSLAAVESSLTFSEAAGLVALAYASFPDGEFVDLLGSLVQQCSGKPLSVTPRAPATITQDQLPDVPSASWTTGRNAETNRGRR